MLIQYVLRQLHLLLFLNLFHFSDKLRQIHRVAEVKEAEVWHTLVGLLFLELAVDCFPVDLSDLSAIRACLSLFVGLVLHVADSIWIAWNVLVSAVDNV